MKLFSQFVKKGFSFLQNWRLILLLKQQETEMAKLFEVRDGKSFIGAYYAKNEKHAIQRAIDEQRTQSSFFRKSMPAVIFKNPTAKEIVPQS